MTVVLQHAVGKAAELMELTHRWHVVSCKVLGARLSWSTEPLIKDNERSLYFEKILAIQRELELLGENDLLVWMDSDCLFRRIDEPLETMLPLDANIGLAADCRSSAYHASWNGGVMAIRPCQGTRDFFDEHYNLGPVKDSEFYRQEGDDGRTNALLEVGVDGVKFAPLDAKWNWSRVTKRPPITYPASESYPVIEAFHCEPHSVKALLIKDRLAKLGGKL